ncbi:MAG: 16S rRNA (guanine(527)-N(7))-methyltransferase RsmG [Cocleimonas sp.]|nr:16S rRNA (guanine(527)-N(7))-methyltransferase RsmG [Cocleimonas sp.]
MTKDELWESGLTSLNCKVDNKQLSLLIQYVDTLSRWNKTYNLTSVRDPKDMIPLHIFDSLVVADFIKGDSCLDVGSGGGLPTIPLAIMQPQREFTALDTNGKKTRFIQQAVIELGLKNVQVVHQRVEKWQAPTTFDAIISRAFASIHDFVSSSSLHLNERGTMYAMKGQYPTAEMQYLPKGFELKDSHKLHVPLVEAERYLLELIRAHPPTFT